MRPLKEEEESKPLRIAIIVFGPYGWRLPFRGRNIASLPGEMQAKNSAQRLLFANGMAGKCAALDAQDIPQKGVGLPRMRASLDIARQFRRPFFFRRGGAGMGKKPAPNIKAPLP